MKRFFVLKNSLIIISSIVVLFLLGKTFFEVKDFHQLDQNTNVKIKQWEIDKDKKDKFYITAIYKYKIDGEKKIGKMIFNKNFNNYAAAFDWLNILAKKNWKAWYSSKNPNLSSLEKKFPIKHCIYSIISISVLLYFSFFQKNFKIWG